MCADMPSVSNMGTSSTMLMTVILRVRFGRLSWASQAKIDGTWRNRVSLSSNSRPPILWALRLNGAGAAP